MRKSGRAMSVLGLIALGGCSQIIGLSDYDVDPKLDAQAGNGSAEGGEPGSQGGSPDGGGTRSQAGQPSAQAGESNGGTLNAGGTPGAAGAPTTPEAGAGGEGGSFIEPPLCTSSQCCKDLGGVATGTELLIDATFENNPLTWTTSTGVFTEATADTIPAHGGKWFAWLGGAVNDVGLLLSPEFTIPKNTGWLVLKGYHWLKFDTTGGLGDSAYLEMYEANGDPLNPQETFFSWTDSGSDTGGWELITREIPVMSYAGGTYQIQVTSITDDIQDDPNGQLASNFFFDDLSFKAFTCVK